MPEQEGGKPQWNQSPGDHDGQSPPEEAKYEGEVTGYFNAVFPQREHAVFREFLSHLVHIDVHILAPTSTEPFYVVFTTGMSDLPMVLPTDMQERADLQHAELFMFLPSTWRPVLNDVAPEKIPDEHFWPIRLLKFLARFPHEYKTWFGWGHTIPNGPDFDPIVDGTRQGGIVFLEFGDKLTPVEAADGALIHLYMAMPAYREEIEYCQTHGMKALADIFKRQDLPLVIDLQRQNYCENLEG